MFWLITDTYICPQNSASAERGPQWTDREVFSLSGCQDQSLVSEAARIGNEKRPCGQNGFWIYAKSPSRSGSGPVGCCGTRLQFFQLRSSDGQYRNNGATKHGPSCLL